MLSVVVAADTAIDDPVPVSATLCGDLIALSVMLSVPVRVPAAVGVKVSMMVHVLPAPTLGPHIFVCAKSPDIAMELTAKSAFPELVSMTVCAALVEPTACVANDSIPADNSTAGAGGGGTVVRGIVLEILGL